MKHTFEDAEAFNSELAWDTSSVTTMHGTFYYATSFNKQIGSWDTSKVRTLGEK